MASWTRTLAGLAALSLVLASCGGNASPAPTTGGTPAPPTAAPSTETPAPTVAPTEVTPTVAPTTGSQGPNLSAAAAALSGLDSYHLRMVMKMEGLENSTFAFFGDGMELEGTFIFRPTQAADISIKMGTEAQKTVIGYRLIGEEAWIGLGDSWMASTAEDAQKTIDTFAPEKMLGSFSGVGGLTAVGDETKNGVATTHYTAPGDVIGMALGTSVGLTDATWSMDLWVARDANYAVGYAVLGNGASGSFEMTLDVSDINDPSNAVERPANVGG